MTTRRIWAIVAIYLLACAGWGVLGTITKLRSEGFSRKLKEPVAQLWGSAVTQHAPSFYRESVNAKAHPEPLMPVRNRVSVHVISDPRKKGLVWYPTYLTTFDARYTLRNDQEEESLLVISFSLPDSQGTYNNFGLFIDDQRVAGHVDAVAGLNHEIVLGPGAEREVRITYETRGKGVWRYVPAPDIGQVKDLEMSISTNFRDVDYPNDCRSPSSSTELSASKSPGDGSLQMAGMELIWKDTELISRQHIGIIVPEKLNPGPVSSRITYFAPVCLLFFFVLIATINVVEKVNVHPMHYLFVAAGFFSFHLLMSYMVGVMPMQVAFATSAVVSVAMVTLYLYEALKGRLPWKTAAAGQLFFLVMFSYTFFLKGVTGLTVAVGSVITLGILMKVTINVDWNSVFQSSQLALDRPRADSVKH